MLADTQSAISLAPAGPILQEARPRVVSLLRCFSMRTMLRAASSVSRLKPTLCTRAQRVSAARQLNYVCRVSAGIDALRALSS